MPKIAKVAPQEADSKEVIRELYKMRGWTQTEFAHEMGYTYQSGVSQLLNNNAGGNSKRSITIATYIRALEALGADLIVRDKMGSGKEWRIDDLLLRESVDSGAKSGKAD